MDCGKCQKPLRVTNTYSAGEGGRTATAKCLKCGRKYVLVTFIHDEEPSYGNGALSVAKKIKNGKPI